MLILQSSPLTCYKIKVVKLTYTSIPNYFVIWHNIWSQVRFDKIHCIIILKDFFCIWCIINFVLVFLYYSYNKKEEDFKTLEEYNDYIEMIETLSKYLYIYRKPQTFQILWNLKYFNVTVTDIAPGGVWTKVL